LLGLSGGGLSGVFSILPHQGSSRTVVHPREELDGLGLRIQNEILLHKDHILDLQNSVKHTQNAIL